MTTTKLGRIELENGQTYFVLLKINCNSQATASLSIIMTDIEKCWKSELDSQFFLSQSERTKCSVEKYLSMMISCLTGTSADATTTDEGSKYVCQVNELANKDAELTWKRQLVEDDVSFKLGMTTLKSTNTAENLQTILSFGVSRIKELEQLTEQQRSEEKRFVEERRNILEKFDSCVTAKEEMERELYAKFVAVLNEKKAEIRRLRASKGVDVKVGAKENVTKRTVSKRNEESIENSDPDDPVSQDEDGDYDTPVIRRKVVVLSTPKDDEDLLLPNSCDESDTMKVLLRSPVKRQQRTSKGVGAKRLPSKSAIKNDSFKASTSKETSTSRKKSVEEIRGQLNSEELLNDMQ